MFSAEWLACYPTSSSWKIAIVCCVGLLRNNLSNALTDVSLHRGQISAGTGVNLFSNAELLIQITVWSQLEKFCTRNCFSLAVYLAVNTGL